MVRETQPPTSMTWQFDARQLRLFREALAVISSPLEASSVDAWRANVVASLSPIFGADAGLFILPHDHGPLATVFNRPPWYFDNYLAHQDLDFSTQIWERQGKPPVMSTLTLCEGDRRVFTSSDIYDVAFHDYRIEDGMSITVAFDDRGFMDHDSRWLPGGVKLSALMALYAERAGTPAFVDGLSGLALFHPALNAATHTIRRLSAAQRELASLIDLSSGAIALYSMDGVPTHHNHALTTLLAADPNAALLTSAMTAMAARFGGVQRRHRLGDVAATQGLLERRVDTGARRYTLRATKVEAIVGQGGSIAITVDAESPAWTDADLVERFALTTREVAVARQIATGASNAVVAERLGISAHTVKRHTEQVLKKLGLRARAEVAALLFGPR